MNYSRECLYDPEWQKLRVTMNGKWVNERGVMQCLSICHNYWARQGESDKAERVWRALNLLNAVKLGWSQNKSWPSEDAVLWVTQESARLSRLHVKFADLMGTLWDWNKVRSELLLMDRRFLQAIHSSLMARAATALRRFDGNSDRVKLNRPELVFFLEMMAQEEDRRDGKPVAALIKVVEKKSPYQGHFRGYRIMATVPNLAATKPFSTTGEKVPSFERPYFLVQFGDYADVESLDAAISKVPKEMKRRGFDKLTWME